jgi:hypothetical protein
VVVWRGYAWHRATDPADLFTKYGLESKHQ